jgi:poly(3-hydroxybutyrate) depolymerase
VSGGAAGRGGAPSGGASGSNSGGKGGGSGTAMKSEGCGTTTTQKAESWVESMVTSGTAMRPYSVWLPENYDAARAYPVVVLLHGCSGGTNNVPMERETGADAIVIRGTGSASGTCWEAAANGPDVVFVDAMIADVKKRFCTDTERFFAVGYSSGSWIANQLGCIRADVLRGIATVAGGDPGVRQCVGPIAQIFVHDQGDMSNQFSGSERARDRLLMQNNCDESIMPVAEDPSPCVRYQGCDPGYPVVWCPTTGQGHNRQDNMAAPAFWNFFQEL